MWDLQHFTKLSDYMWELSTEIYQGKLRALEAGDEAVQEQISRGKDIMSVLMNENMKASDDEKLDEDELIGQVNVVRCFGRCSSSSSELERFTSTLIFAAMDTTSGALARTFHLLAQNPEVQSKLRQELREAREAQGGEDVPYDILVALPYLDAICRETLRLYTPAPRITRQSNQTAILPLSTPIRCTDGSVINEITVPADTKVLIDILNANRNPELWGPDAMEWKPERWLSSLPSTLAKAKSPGIYSHLMTFSGGGRSCIGFKFSQTEMKAVLFQLVEAFEFRPADQEIYWQSNPVVSPIIKGGLQGAKLPIKISLAK
ncbi:hypothetical protein AAF712_014175 [Marasmius tenuissimus]|uniref:Cytochrome P450 n=1 Tax=Marasmius tenuissimus TaxID=585030 RepID=A0ABR2ZD11_9AGAR